MISLNKTNEKILVCPYDEAHQVKSHQIFDHINRCKVAIKEKSKGNNILICKADPLIIYTEKNKNNHFLKCKKCDPEFEVEEDFQQQIAFDPFDINESCILELTDDQKTSGKSTGYDMKSKNYSSKTSVKRKDSDTKKRKDSIDDPIPIEEEGLQDKDQPFPFFIIN